MHIIIFDVVPIMEDRTCGKEFQVSLEVDKEVAEIYQLWIDGQEAYKKTQCAMCMGSVAGALAFLPMDKKMYAEINETNAFANKKEEDEYNQANEVYNKKTGEFYRKATELLLKKGLIEPKDKVYHHYIIYDLINKK